MDKKIEEQIEELQVLEQNLQQMTMQKQVLQSQLMEVDNALEEIAKNPKQLFKIAGPLIVESSKEVLEKDLKSRKEVIDVKLKNVDKQEDKLRQKAKEVQAQVLSKMQKNG
ncbi:MAG: prefoldin subunit [Candidatus Woesearchaeota archaeon]